MSDVLSFFLLIGASHPLHFLSHYLAQLLSGHIAAMPSVIFSINLKIEVVRSVPLISRP